MRFQLTLTATMDKNSFKQKFPNLYKELEGGDSKVTIKSVRTDPENAEEMLGSKLRNFDPTVVDFIRRCDTEEQAEEIIAYLEKRCEITPKRASKLKSQLKKRGVRSFGPKKGDNYYFKQDGY